MKKKIIYGFLLLVLFTIQLGLQKSVTKKINTQTKPTFFFPKHFWLGHQLSASSIYWISVLLDSPSARPLEYFKQIIQLNPKFFTAYQVGYIYLSVFENDHEGAIEISKYWLKKEPRDWKPYYYLGLEYFWKGQVEQGGQFILKASQLERAPGWLSSLSVRMLSQSGKWLEALKLSLELYPHIRDVEGQNRLLQRIEALDYWIKKKTYLNNKDSYKAQYRSLVADVNLKDPALFSILNREYSFKKISEKDEPKLNTYANTQG